jgi:PAS domain S-box-containing protein
MLDETGTPADVPASVAAATAWSGEAAASLLRRCEQIVTEAPSITQAVELTAVEIRRATKWRFAESYLFDPRAESSYLLGADHEGTPADVELARSRAIASHGRIDPLFADELRSGRVFLVDPLVPSPRISRGAEALASGIVSVIGLPLFRHNAPFAVLVFAHDAPLRGTPWAERLQSLVAPLTAIFARRAREIEFGALWDLSPDAMVLIDFSGRLLEMNPAFTATLGWTADQIGGDFGMRMVHPDDAPIAGEMLAMIARGEHLERPLLIRLLKPDGSYVSIHLRSRALPSESSILLIGRDLSTVEHLEQENSRLARAYRLLQASNELGRQAKSEVELFERACTLAVEIGGYKMTWVGQLNEVRQTVEPVASFGDTTNYLDGLYVSLQGGEAGHGLTGRAVRQRTHQISHDILADTTMEEWCARAERAGFRASAAYPILIGEAVIGSMTFYTPATEWFGPDEVIVLHDVVRNIGSAVESLRREARRVEAEAAMRRLEASRLRTQRLESIGTLAGGIAHDLNNTLAPILMSAEMLGGLVTEEMARNYVRIIMQSAQIGAALVRQVLGFARGLEGERIQLSPPQLARDVADMLSDTMLQSVRVVTEVEDGVTPILGDPTQLHQVLLNLCVNAAQAMGREGTVWVRCAMTTLDDERAAGIIGGRAGTFVTFEVRDTGTGVSPDLLERIFDPFFTTKPQGSGTGLGLSTSLGIVRSHLGFIEVESVLGEGATFRVYLPALPDNGAATATALAPEIGAPQPNGRGECILVVEDEGVVRALVRETLERAGYRVVLAENGAQGAEAFASDPDAFALVITDLWMPVLGGRDMLERLHRLRPSLRAIVTTGFDDTPADSVMWRALGVLRFLHKPFTTRDLLANVRDVLDLQPEEVANMWREAGDPDGRTLHARP